MCNTETISWKKIWTYPATLYTSTQDMQLEPTILNLYKFRHTCVFKHAYISLTYFIKQWHYDIPLPLKKKSMSTMKLIAVSKKLTDWP